MVNLCASYMSDKRNGRNLQKMGSDKVFSLNFKQLICLIEKFRLSLRFYIDNYYLICNKKEK